MKPMTVATLRRLMAAPDAPQAAWEERLRAAEQRGRLFGLLVFMARRRAK